MPTTNKVTNRLINEKSPYLLQHANNPVNWYPWGDEAFNEARSENKPIFLSIGYSTCHWCHVMEHESFEDNEVAELMNENFVSIKVDREERPDIDSIYMNGCQRMTGQGGWPLTVLMTPEKKPFFFASYIPKYSVHGAVGMIELIKKVKILWENENDSVIDSAERITESLKNISIQNSDKDLRTSVIHSAFIELENSFDDVHGGFGYEPKFPVPENILFLFRYYKKTKDKKALNMALKTLDSMAEGGIFDHVGYGFHRYSTDAQWLVPHFEKMLYDQALISYAYVEAYQITQDDRYKEFAEKIFEYVLRDMRSEEGVFYSAEDADSEGEEGKFYLWTYEELKKVLSEDELSIVNKVFGIENEGNFINRLTGEKTGYNIIYCKMKPSEMDNNMRDRVESIRQKLYNARSKRIRPHRDDKVLIDWNGLMISSLAKAGAVFNNTEYTNAAKKAAEFILNSIKENGNLFHRYVKGEWNFRANADDYAFLIHALIELYEADFNIDFLKWALKLNDNFIENFWDEQSGGFYFTQKGGTDVFMRMKEVYDGAVPSGNSIEFLNLIKLSRLTGNQSLEKYADSIQKVFSKQIQENPSSYTCFLMAFIYFTEPSFEIVVTGGNNSEEMLKLINKKYIPNKVVVFSPINEYNADLYETIGYIENYKDINGEAAAYICRGFTCEAPIKDINKLSNILDI